MQASAQLCRSLGGVTVVACHAWRRAAGLTPHLLRGLGPDGHPVLYLVNALIAVNKEWPEDCIVDPRTEASSLLGQSSQKRVRLQPRSGGEATAPRWLDPKCCPRQML
jgi:hypothetical protein